MRGFIGWITSTRNILCESDEVALLKEGVQPLEDDVDMPVLN